MATQLLGSGVVLITIEIVLTKCNHKGHAVTFRTKIDPLKVSERMSLHTLQVFIWKGEKYIETSFVICTVNIIGMNKVARGLVSNGETACMRRSRKGIREVTISET
jgi:hypothetical protein